jgi:hypothetical protein
VENEIGHALPIFSYPNGSHDDSVVDILGEERFRIAFTQRPGMNDLRSEAALRLRRTNVTRRNTLPVFVARLHPWADRLERWRERLEASR